MDMAPTGAAFVQLQLLCVGELTKQQTLREVDAWLTIRRNVTGFSACLSSQVSTGPAMRNSAYSDSLSSGSMPWISTGCTGSVTPSALADDGCGVAGPTRPEEFEVSSSPGDSPCGYTANLPVRMDHQLSSIKSNACR